MKTYKQLISEMAIDIGKPFSMLHNRSGYSSQLFHETKTHPVISEIAQNIKVHKHVNGDFTDFTVNNHDSHQALYNSTIVHNKPTPDIPFEHIEQSLVDRAKSHIILPKNFATDFVYNHWKSQTLPLKSSNTQYHTGRDMWTRLIDIAHNDGKHVLFMDIDKSITSVTPENKSQMLTNYYGKSSDFGKRHLIISHEKISTNAN